MNTCRLVLLQLVRKHETHVNSAERECECDATVCWLHYGQIILKCLISCLLSIYLKRTRALPVVVPMSLFLIPFPLIQELQHVCEIHVALYMYTEVIHHPSLQNKQYLMPSHFTLNYEYSKCTGYL